VSRWKIHEMQRGSGLWSHRLGLDGSGMPFLDLHSAPLFSDPLMGLAPAHLTLKGCATAQAKPCLPPLGGPQWYKSYFPLFLFLMQQISDWRELIGLRSSPCRGEWLGEARVQMRQMRSNGQASNS
jgi:hypothetical protein